MTGTRRIVLDVSPELFGRMQARAAGERYDTDEWILRTVIGALLKPESAAERRAREALLALQSPQAGHMPAERSVAHAAHI
jgi:hypothetical protein